MKQTSDFDETEVMLLLLEGGASRGEGLARIDQEYRLRIGAYLRACFPGMRGEDLSECYVDALIRLMEALRLYDRSPSESTFDPDRPLQPYLRKIAYRRAVDRLRKAGRHEEFLRSVGSALGGTDVGEHWSQLSPPERREIRTETCKAIAKLPPKERLVWGIYMERFLEVGSPPGERELHALVCERDGPEHTFVSVKRALNNGRAAVRRHLEAKGFRDRGLIGEGT